MISIQVSNFINDANLIYEENKNGNVVLMIIKPKNFFLRSPHYEWKGDDK